MRTVPVFAIICAVIGCGSDKSNAQQPQTSSNQTVDGGLAGETGPAADSAPTADSGSETGATGPGCTTTGRVICNTNLASAIAEGPNVTAMAGQGSPPIPTGGAVANGSTYKLVAETVYGTPPFDVFPPVLGSQISEALAVSCDTFNEITSFTAASRGISGQSNACGRLVPHALSLVDVAGYDPDASDMFHNDVAYSATSTTLTLISLRAYLDLARGVVAGSYTIVDEFELTSADAAPATGSVPDGSPLPRQPRDPRCPASAPSMGDACNPAPPPLECEYGGDAWGRCTTFAICGLKPDGSFAFVTSTDKSCTPNPAACPAAFGSPSEGGDAAVPVDANIPPGSSCTNNGLQCAYTEGACQCFPAWSGDGGVALSWTCRARSDVRSNPSGQGCPTQRPLAGDGCPLEGQHCAYGSPCGLAPSLGPSLFCVNGYWEYEDGVTSCPAEPAL
jgi:hypothetical protein